MPRQEGRVLCVDTGTSSVLAAYLHMYGVHGAELESFRLRFFPLPFTLFAIDT